MRVVDGKTGFLVAQRNVEGMTGCAYVEANYDIDKLNDRLVELYMKVLHSPQKSTHN